MTAFDPFRSLGGLQLSHLLKLRIERILAREFPLFARRLSDFNVSLGRYFFAGVTVDF